MDQLPPIQNHVYGKAHEPAADQEGILPANVLNVVAQFLAPRKEGGIQQENDAVAIQTIHKLFEAMETRPNAWTHQIIRTVKQDGFDSYAALNARLLRVMNGY